MKRAAATLLLGLVVSGGVTACGGKPLDQQPGYDDAHFRAQLYCSMTVNAGLYSDEMTRCIDEQTRINMHKGSH